MRLARRRRGLAEAVIAYTAALTLSYGLRGWKGLGGRGNTGEEQPLLPGGAGGSLGTFLRSAITLREIHSVKLTRAEKRGQWLKFALIGLSTTATCIGFIGIGDLANDLNIGSKLVTVVMNAFLLLLLIAVIAELSWRFGERAAEHQRALVVLTAFIRDLENRLRQPIERGDADLVERFGERHKLLVEILPPHTDADYIRAKQATAKKDLAKRKIETEYEI